jgi:putative ABC transport system permease protein
MEIPLGGGGYRIWQGFEVIGHADTGRQKTLAVSNNVTPHFFTVMQIPVRRGRGLSDRDDAAAAPVVAVSETFARTFLPGEDPLGQHLRLEGDTKLWEIVGVVGDVKPDGLDSRPNPMVYKPFAQEPKPFMAIIVRSRTEPEALSTSLTRELLRIDRDVPPYRVRSAEKLVAQSLAARRFGTTLMAAFAATALVLAMVGLYAVISNLIAGRTREIGLRVALGASPAGVLRSVLSQALAPSSLGLVLGMLIALLTVPSMRRLLYGVEPLDPVVLLLVPIALAGAGVLACVVPARRALRVDPVIALRAE